MSKEGINMAPPRASKTEALQNLRAPLSSSLSSLSSSSNAIPGNMEFHFYYNFDDFKLPIQEISQNSQSMLRTIGSSTQIWDKSMPLPDVVDAQNGYDWLVDVNDELFERFDVSIDEFERIRKKEEELGRPLLSMSNRGNGLKIVDGKNKMGVSYSGNEIGSGKEDLLGVKIAARDKHASGMSRAKVPFHIPTIRRPQDEYNIFVNNSNQPFQHVWLQTSEDGQRFIHPLENHSVLRFVDKGNRDIEPIEPPSIHRTPFKLVEEVKDLKILVAKLRNVNEFAVDLEHNQYRSFQGITCLMQISTRTEDFVVDTLKLRIHVGPYLREVFKDPTKKKVIHGADKDILWLQRDFGIYLCNLFDTGQASRVMKLERNSLEFLLYHFCGVTANKEYQNADWRLRPLPDEMLRYAREDTHYLLYMYDIMKIQLLSMPKEPDHSDDPIVEVYKRSNDICMMLYEKELLTEHSYLHIYGLQGAGFNAEQLAIVSGLCEWRDVIARVEDESTGYILPNKTLLEIAKQMPGTADDLCRLLKSKHPYVERNLGSLVSIIGQAIQNAAAFEAVAPHFKLRDSEIASSANMEEICASEAVPPEAFTGMSIANARPENSTAVNGSTSVSVHLLTSLHGKEKSLLLGSKVTERNRVRKEGRFEPPALNGNVKAEYVSSTSVLPSGSFTSVSTSSAKVAEANVQILKKPCHGFGALLGNGPSKRKLVTEKKVSEEMKLEQIRSSANLRFHSFSGSDSSLKSVVDVSTTTMQPAKLEYPSTLPPTDSKLGDIILLEEPKNCSPSLSEDKSAGSSLSMALSDELLFSTAMQPAKLEQPSTLPATDSKLVDIIVLEDDDPNLGDIIVLEDDDPNIKEQRMVTPPL